MKRQNKKGFTLAELLIVVAILAVLTAIAVPLFISSINKAEDAAHAANVDAVRSAAIVKILESNYADGGTNYWSTDPANGYRTGDAKNPAGGGSGFDLYEWFVEAKIVDGKITDLTIKNRTQASIETTSHEFTKGYTNGWKDGTVRIVLNDTQIKTA